MRSRALRIAIDSVVFGLLAPPILGILASIMLQIFGPDRRGMDSMYAAYFEVMMMGLIAIPYIFPFAVIVAVVRHAASQPVPTNPTRDTDAKK